jgi:tRNA A37 threonylcarbamoyladenosine biosynthesis protein TsaE
MQRHHGARGDFLHVDLYRLEPDQLAAIGLEEELAGPGVKLVEWPERLTAVPSGAVWIHLERGAGEEERILIERPLPADRRPAASEGDEHG